MKKLFLIAALTIAAFGTKAQSNVSTVQWPFGSVTTTTIAATGSTTITINNQRTIIDAATTQLTGNATIVLAIGTNVKPGAEIFLKSATTGTTTLTFSTGFLAPTLTGVAGKTFGNILWYDGTNFLQCAAPVQLN